MQNEPLFINVGGLYDGPKIPWIMEDNL